jgi:hypothetical protein
VHGDGQGVRVLAHVRTGTHFVHALPPPSQFGPPQVQQKMIAKSFTSPGRFRSILLTAEGTAASSSHPGDWRYKDVQYD